MKFKFQATSLAKTLGSLVNSIDIKSVSTAMPSLIAVRFELNESGEFNLSMTDLKTTVSIVTIPEDLVLETATPPHVFLVDAERLWVICKNAGKQSLLFNEKGSTLKITSETSEFKLPLIISSYPDPSLISYSTEVTLPGKELEFLLSYSDYSATPMESYGGVTGSVLIKNIGGFIVATGTDGRRISIARVKNDLEFPELLIPKKVSKVIADMAGAAKSEVSIRVGDKLNSFSVIVDNLTLIIVKPVAAFPNCEKFIPKVEDCPNFQVKVSEFKPRIEDIMCLKESDAACSFLAKENSLVLEQETKFGHGKSVVSIADPVKEEIKFALHLPQLNPYIHSLKSEVVDIFVTSQIVYFISSSPQGFAEYLQTQTITKGG